MFRVMETCLTITEILHYVFSSHRSEERGVKVNVLCLL